MSVVDLLSFAEQQRVAALDDRDVRQQADLGQFFTPAEAAELIASIPRVPDSSSIRVLDPGAGSGVLSAALIKRLLVTSDTQVINLVAVERDVAMIKHLKATLEECVRAGKGRVTYEVIEADFILDSLGLDPSLDFFGGFDLVIENPPYGKLSVSSPHRSALRSQGTDVPNLYAAFLELSVSALKPGGQVVAITPRSFFNGPYFAEFRSRLLDSVSIDRIHTFDSRSTVFADTGVLQENVVFSGTKNTVSTTVDLTASTDHLSETRLRQVPYAEVVHPDDPHRFIRLAINEEETAIAETMLSQPCRLEDLGIQVSTGRVVDFRSRHALSDAELDGSVPLVYPGNLKNGSVSWPAEIRKPQWFVPSSDQDLKLLLPEGWYSIVKRFSSKEERRRITASIWSPSKNPGNVAFENHLNVFHMNAGGIDETLARGLTVWLNSTLVDTYFRTFSGHTQVNATDLRTLRYPDLDSLHKLGKKSVSGQDEIDQVVTKLVAQ